MSRRDDIHPGAPKPPQDPPADQAKLAVWRRGLQAPTTFVVTEEVGRAALEQWADGEELLEFDSYPDGSGRRSRTLIQTTDVVGLTLEHSTLKLASSR